MIITDSGLQRLPQPLLRHLPGTKENIPQVTSAFRLSCWYLRPDQGLSATDEELMGELTLDELKMAFRFEEELWDRADNAQYLL